MNLFPVNAQPVPAPDQANDRKVEENRLQEACQDFEAILLGQMFTSMRSTGFKSDLFGESKEEEMFHQMLDQEMANAMSRQQGIGLASLLFEQLKGQL